MNDDLMAELMGGPMAIYHRVLALAQRKSRVDIELTSADIRAMGVSKNYVTIRGQVGTSGTRQGDSQAGQGASFPFELLDPKTRLPVPTPYERGTALAPTT